VANDMQTTADAEREYYEARLAEAVGKLKTLGRARDTSVAEAQELRRKNTMLQIQLDAVTLELARAKGEDV